MSSNPQSKPMGSPLRSPLREANPVLALPPPPLPESMKSTSPTRSPPVVVLNRVNREEMPAMTKLEEGRGVDGGGGGEGGDRGSRVVTGIVRRSKREAAVRRAGAGLRVSAAVLSLISFSVMAADKTKGWAGDSFDRYREYQYCISVTVMTFVYSSFQVYAHVHQTIKGKDIFQSPTRYYFDLFMDQVLAYLLMSASTAAATRNDDWVSNWGSDPFTVMINGSISMSFLAFIALAISSLISAYNLFSRGT